MSFNCGEFTGEGGAVMRLCAAVLGMGWLSSVGVAQHFIRELALRVPRLGAGLPPASELRRDANPPKLSDNGDGSFWSVYMDDFDVCEVDEKVAIVTKLGSAHDWQEAMRAAFEYWDIPRGEDKAVCRSLEVDTLGATLDGVGARAFGTSKKLLQLVSLLEYVMKSHGVPKTLLEMGATEASTKLSLDLGAGENRSRVLGENLLLVSLFDGIGGLRRSFEVANIPLCGSVVVELHAGGRRVVAAHWPDTVHLEDVRHFSREFVDQLRRRFVRTTRVVVGAGPLGQNFGGLRAIRSEIAECRWSLVREIPRIVKLLDEGFDVPVEMFVESVASLSSDHLEEVNQILVDYRTGDIHVPKVPMTEALALMASDFVNAITTGKTPDSDAALGVEVVEILAAAQESIKINAEVIL